MKKMRRFLVGLYSALFLICAATVPCAAAKVTNPFYSFQVAAYPTAQEAEAHVKALHGKGFETFYVKALVSGKIWYRVCMGQYATSREAQRDAELLRKRGVVKEYHLRKVQRFEVLGAPSAPAVKARKEEPKAKKDVRAGKETPPPTEKGVTAPAEQKSPPTPESRETPGQEKVGAISLAVPPEREDRGEIVEPKTPLSPYESAEIDLKAGRYEEAAHKFEEMNRKGQVYESNREAVLRGLADACYFQGEQGSGVALEKAIENYEKLLSAYPQHKDSNANAHLRLARSYLILNRHAEAYREFENLYSKYPDSPHVPEATFATGVTLYRLGKYPQAIERFKEYLQKNPDGDYVKHAYFWIADCYSQIKDMDQAEVWYRDGLRRFPDHSDLPKDVMVHLGMHFFRNHHFSEAADTYFRYVNLYPDGPFQKEVLFMIGRCLTEMDQLPAALKVYSMLIEKYPGSREAQECTMIMANIAVRKPDLKFPVAMLGEENVRDPVSTYDDLLRKSPQPDVEEALLFQKGYALAQHGRHKEAFDTFDTIMQRFPRGKFKPATIENLRKNAEILVDSYYVRGDYLAVSDIYFRIYANGVAKGYDAMTGFKMAESLRRTGLYAQAMPFFNDLMKRSEKKLQASILISMAEIKYHEGKHGDAEAILQSMLKGFPGAEQREQVRARRILADVYARKGLNGKAVSLYEEVTKSGLVPEDPAVFYRNYGHALKDTKACPAAIGFYQTAIKHYQGDRERYPVEVASESYTGLGDCLMTEKNYAQAVSAYRKSLEADPDGRQSLWTLYQMGKGYLALNDEPSANRVFSELKLKGGEAFWAGLADFSVQDRQWSGTYRKYARQP
ncbi:MAG TPA: tetratricopeptide repeat protein [Syntrophales bacterium]|nr:tetratricopeptide repeat protein [Syntrophales bacterium]HOX93452.1 tetratricopeptide repeat protein [Syntrophales bacterium]HPI56671.1 tetratricopeptide repeat protein [Syntrophales bacterium]HPN24903.1 tetratricopeptide repeat protein [Syntrophales bacterium]HQM29712.1 tetratricopeptide repeat protein [Syntrophales bacterium]